MSAEPNEHNEHNEHNDHANELPTDSGSTLFRPLRVWPVLFLLLAMVVTRMLPKLVEDGPPTIWMAAAFGPLLCGILVVLWWLVASRATWRERLVGCLGIVLALVVSLVLVDPSMRGPATMILTVPMGTAAFALSAVLCSRMLTFHRTTTALLLAICGFGFSTLLRSDGMWGDFALGLHWRWLPSPEEQMLAAKQDQISVTLDEVASANVDQALLNPEWPSFRGADRTSRQTGMQFALDWDTSAPKELWRIAVGPGWSSFAVAGDLLFTQEQRGKMETVVCYDAKTGREVWTHEVESRFHDPLGGPGPRGTPTLAGGGLFVSGAEGFVTRLDPKTGEVVWQQDLRELADRQPPMWGFSSSPLVVDSNVIVYAGGKADKGTFAFDAESGDLSWSAAAGDHSYSSPQLCQLAGEDYVLMLTNKGLDVLDPVTGDARLNYEWKHEGYRSLQPQVVDDDSILIPTGMGIGTRRIRVKTSGDKLIADELWTSRDLKPDFNDFVVYQGHAYGFDDAIFACVDLESGQRRWKRGRYGKGQVLLLEDSAALLIISEKGELVLLKADPTKHTELAKLTALEGKTWNHPVVAGDRLYIRNAQEAACYRLPLASGQSANKAKVSAPAE